jgi:UDP-2,3-diacylglucosamine pyrophosphatase LpxH
LEQPPRVLDRDLAAEFGDVYRDLHAPVDQVGFTTLLAEAWRGRSDGILALIQDGKEIPERRLSQLRVSISKILQQHIPACDHQYDAAQRMNAAGTEVVIMGHTHEFKHEGHENKAHYINTGTWTDRTKISASDLADNKSLNTFIRKLLRNDLRDPRSSYARVTFDESGNILSARGEPAWTA